MEKTSYYGIHGVWLVPAPEEEGNTLKYKGRTFPEPLLTNWMWGMFLGEIRRGITYAIIEGVAGPRFCRYVKAHARTVKEFILQHGKPNINI